MDRLRPHLVDVAVPAGVGAVVALTTVARGDATAVTLALGLGSAAVLVACRRAPGLTFVASAALVLGLFAAQHRAGSSAVLSPAVALYFFALARGRFRVGVAALAAIAAVVTADGVHHGFRYQTLGHMALVGVPVLAAEAMRNRRSYVALLVERLELAERTREEEARRGVEQERLRIARDLHDVVAHTLTTINVQAGVARHLLDRRPDNARDALATIEAASRDALDELRGIVGVLREAEADGAPRAPSPTLEGIRELVERTRDGGLEVGYELTGEPPRSVSAALELAAFRIVQESLTNARRHAPGAPARVTLSFEPDRLHLVVANATAATANGAAGVGVGIVGMKERAAAVGGTLDAGPAADGFRVTADLPYRRGA